jgi:hypothetical protein
MNEVLLGSGKRDDQLKPVPQGGLTGGEDNMMVARDVEV